MRSPFKNGIKERFPSDVGILIHQAFKGVPVDFRPNLRILDQIFKDTHPKKLMILKLKGKFAKWHRDYVEKIGSIIYPTWQNFDQKFFEIFTLWFL